MSDEQLDRLPSRGELAAWRAFLRAHATVTRCLEADLINEQRLTLGAYDLMAQLADAPRRRMRMNELAAAVLLSRSGATRLVSRLERSGYVHRLPVDDDGRGVLAVLTEAGLRRLRHASHTHLTGVVRYFADATGPEELDAFARTCVRLAEREAPAAPGEDADA